MKTSALSGPLKNEILAVPFRRQEMSATPNLLRTMRAFFCLCFLFALGFAAAQADSAIVKGVTAKDGKVYLMSGNDLKLLTNDFTLPFDVEVSTNGTFKVGDDGKDRTLLNGQEIRTDGWLINPDGSIEPVFDHIAVKAGKVIVVRDGQANTLTEPMTCTNGLNLSPDGYGVYPNGIRNRLLDGQLFQMDGSIIPAKDAVTLVNGQVVVQREGSLIHLVPVQMMGMPDGTKVYGKGTIEKLDGTTIQLQEGKTILLTGINVGH